MFVRTIYVTGDPEQIETAVRALNSEGRELLEERPGYRGAGVFVDRELGKLLGVSWWDSEKARHNSDEVMREHRPAMLRPFAGTLAVENFEAVVYHAVGVPRAGGGLRVTRVEFDPADARIFADTFRSAVLPRLEEMHGLATAGLFLDRERGTGQVGALFTDRASMAASRAAQAAVRHDTAAKVRVDVVGLEEFEVVHADVRPG
ncbi:antibiotic biosynthesis monooxygenase [Streptomyces sp. NPDC005573]|uniref:antibiotic biosynthesis monooxygenase n=1 Tax=Streptomyces sp. NPDC005573 TaxID=3156890 RepID=UPI00339F4190